MTLFDRFLTLLSGEPERAAAPARSPAPAADAGPQAPQAKADFQQKLHAVLARGGTAVGGRVHLLNLGTLAERFGPRWPALTDKVDQLIRLSLSRRLSPRDFFARCEDGVYVVVFDGLSEAEARLKCALIADEIAGKLFGQNAAMSAIDVCSATARVDGGLDFASFDTADALSALLAQADQYSARDAARPDHPQGGLAPVVEGMLRQVELELSPRLPKGADAPAPDPDRLGALLALLRDAERALAVTLPNAAAAAADPAWTVLEHIPASPASSAAGNADLLPVLRGLIERTEAALATAGAGLVAVPRTGEELENAELAFLYSPLWHVPRQVINARLCHVGMRAGARLVTGGALLPETADSRLVALVDRVVALKAVAGLDALGSQAGKGGGGKGVLVVPVHHSTLAGGPISREFLGLCRSVAPHLRPLLVWELVEPAGSLTALHLPAAVNALKGSGRAVLVRVDIDYPRFEDFLGIGVYAVGTDIDGLDLPEADIIRKLQIFRARAERYGLRCYVNGVRTLSLLAAAVCDGFEYVGGEIIGPDLDQLRAIEPFELGDAYAHVYADPAALPANVRAKDPRS